MGAQTTMMAPAAMALAVPCRKCGELFDLSYDLDPTGDMADVLSVLRSKMTRRQTLCWKCRAS